MVGPAMAPARARTQGSSSSRCSARSWAALAACPLALAVPKFAQRLGRRAGASIRRGRRPSVRAKTSSLDDFDLLDENGDGTLSREEFAKGRAGLPQTQVTSGGQVLEQKLQGFKQYLVECEETGPPQYRVAESFLVALGTICFVTRVVSPDIAAELFLAEVEDIVNVSFFIKFLLLFWINEFDISWLFTGSGALDVASCLPVLCIPARLIGGPSLEQTFDLLQIGRFLRSWVGSAVSYTFLFMFLRDSWEVHWIFVMYLGDSLEIYWIFVMYLRNSLEVSW